MSGVRKYGNKKVAVDGITFDSKKEAGRYQKLKLLEQAGEISDLKLQVKYVLVPAQFEQVWKPRLKEFRNGKCLERECAYIADFVYKDRFGIEHVEDTKGMKTKDYIIKRKLMLYIHGIRIQEV